MASCFNDLPDLVLFEIFQYLKSLDVLYSFSNFNERLYNLLWEKFYFRNIDLTCNDEHSRIKSDYVCSTILQFEGEFVHTFRLNGQLDHTEQLQRLVLPNLKIVELIELPKTVDQLELLLLKIVNTSQITIRLGTSLEVRPTYSLIVLYEKIFNQLVSLNVCDVHSPFGVDFRLVNTEIIRYELTYDDLDYIVRHLKHLKHLKFKYNGNLLYTTINGLLLEETLSGLKTLIELHFKIKIPYRDEENYNEFVSTFQTHYWQCNWDRRVRFETKEDSVQKKYIHAIL
ncbi:unnamed protein product [Didymodactylos carnosus]|nr:unnamed protein product [Didymodactylos carnosus]CAF3798836.1 unnamed protein product [Didymodactylos carnosus]